jgi:hypothetical protein
MAEASLQDWLDDARESLAIGRRIGERVVIMGTSTGRTLATWPSLQPEGPAPWATVLISPNFGSRRWESELLTWPWAQNFVPLVRGGGPSFSLLLIGCPSPRGESPFRVAAPSLGGRANRFLAQSLRPPQQGLRAPDADQRNLDLSGDDQAYGQPVGLAQSFQTAS